MFRNLMVLSLVFLFPAQILAQEETKAPSWVPKSGPHSIYIHLENVSIAKASQDGKAIHIAKPKFAAETHVRTVAKTVQKPEQRVRNVEKDGKVVEETYTVLVPVTLEEAQTYVVYKPMGFGKFKISLEQVRAWDVSGKIIDADDLVKRLENSTNVLAVEHYGDFVPLDPFYRSVLRPDTIVIYAAVGTMQDKDAKPLPVAPAAPVAPVPAAPAAPPVPAPKA